MGALRPCARLAFSDPHCAHRFGGAFEKEGPGNGPVVNHAVLEEAPAEAAVGAVGPHGAGLGEELGHGPGPVLGGLAESREEALVRGH